MKNTKFIFCFKIYLVFMVMLGFSGTILLQGANAQSFWDQQVGMGTDSKGVGNAYGETGDPTDVRLTIAKIINVFLGFLGIIFLGLVVYAGFTWMTANGEEAKISKAKSTLVAGIIGLIIIASSFAISVYITDQIVGATISG